MRGYIYCKKCEKIIAELDDTEYVQMKENGELPVLCDVCFAKEIDLDKELYYIFNE